MPKAVFSLFWSTIQAGKPICAYVKNMAANGDYYWVFACVFPITDGYLSVRIKPSTALFEAAQAFYPAVLQEEKKNGVEAGGKLLFQLLSEAGFPDYESFMTRALVLEITERQKILTENATLVTTIGTGLSRTVYLRNRDLGQMVARLTAFANINKTLSSSIKQMMDTFGSLRSLTINMSLASSHLGKTANTLAVVSESFQNFANETFQEVQNFNQCLIQSRAALQKSEFQITAAFLQNQMLSYFINDPTEKVNEQNLSLLREMSTALSRGAAGALQEAEESLRNFYVSAETTEKAIIALEVVRQTGKVEAAQIPGATESVDPYLQEMLKITKNINSLRREIAQGMELFLKDIVNMREQSNDIEALRF